MATYEGCVPLPRALYPLPNHLRCGPSPAELQLLVPTFPGRSQLDNFYVFGAQLGVLDGDRGFPTQHRNHGSALRRHRAVEAKLYEEVALGNTIAIPLAHAATMATEHGVNFRVCPLGALDKPNGDIRLLTDASFGDNSVNSGIWKTASYRCAQAHTRVSDVTHAAEFYRDTGHQDLHLVSGDAHHAYRCVVITAEDWPLVSYILGQTLFVETRATFGCASSDYLFGVRADAATWAMLDAGALFWRFVDDWLGLFPNKQRAEWGELVMQRSLHHNKIPESTTKRGAATRRLVYIGFLFSLIENTISVPPHKLAKLVHTLKQWAGRRNVSVKLLASLVGSLGHAARVYTFSRPHLWRLYGVVAHAQAAGRRHVRVPLAAMHDLRWWAQAVTVDRCLLSPVPIIPTRCNRGELATDAATTGYGIDMGFFRHSYVRVWRVE